MKTYLSNYYPELILLLIVTAIPVFSHLNTLPIQPYDEARVVINSLELYIHKGNVLIPTYGNAPDMWNTKPPLLIWLQVLSMKIFGVNEIGVRLPSALAALGTCLLLFWFCARKLNKPLLGLLTVLILVSSEGYIRIHSTRTADYDALLTFFTTAYCLLFYLFLSFKKGKYILWSFLCMTLAVLTKGIAALFFLPALGAFVLLRPSHYFIFRSKHFYIGLLAFIVVSLGYYFLREQYNPGYIDAVMQNELGSRFNTVIEGHIGERWFYFYRITDIGFKYWVWMVPFGCFIGLTTASRRIRYFTLFTIMLVLCHFFVITQAETKIDWYDVPEYPFLSLLAGLFIFYLLRSVSVTLHSHRKLRNKWLSYLFAFFFFTIPYYNIIESVSDPKTGPWLTENLNMGTFLKDARDGKHDIKNYTIVWDCDEPNIYWYLLADRGKNNLSGKYSNELQPGCTAAVFKESTKKYVEKTYFSTVVRNYNGVTVYNIYGHR